MKAFGRIRLGWAVAVVVLAVAAVAQKPGAPGSGVAQGFATRRPPMERAMGAQNGQGRWWNRPGIVERLKLTDEQRKSFDDILLAHREKLIDLRANLAKAELALEPLMRGNPPDEGKVLAQIDTIAQARAELEKANAAFLLEIRARLTPEQWKQLQAARANRGQIRGGVQGGSGQYRPQAQAPTVPEEDVIPEPAASGTER